MTKKRIVAAAVTLCVLALWTGGSAVAQMAPPAIPQWAAMVHQLALKDSSAGFFPTVPTGVFPPLIPEYLPSLDPSGVVETYNLGAPTLTGKNAFFQSLGSNGRACATCHEPRSSWGVSAASINQRFYASHRTDPIFSVQSTSDLCYR